MSREMNRKDQAEQLLRAMTDIDERFLLEAMADPASEDGEIRDGGTAFMESGDEGPAFRVSGNETAADNTSGIKRAKPSGNKLRRYSRWALTAAACLTVVVIGRYVSVNSVRSGNESSMTVAEVQKDSEAAMDAEDVAAGAAEKADAEAVEQPVAEEEKRSAEKKSVQTSAALDYAAESVAPVTAAEAPAEAAAEGTADNSAGESSPAMNAAAGAGAAMTIANPFVDVQTIEEAQEEAGFSISLPEAEAPYDNPLYRAIRGQMIEVIFLDEDGREGYRIRKGKNMEEDISGDYNTYPAEDTLELEGMQILVRGDSEDQWCTAVWNEATDGGQDAAGYSYAVCADQKTFTSDEILAMAKELSE